MKAYRHRIEVHARDGRFLGAAEFKTARKSGDRVIQKMLLGNVTTVVRAPKEHVCTFTLNEKIEYRA